MRRWILSAALLIGFLCGARADMLNIPPPFLVPNIKATAASGGSNVLLVDTGVALLANTGVKLLVQ